MAPPPSSASGANGGNGPRCGNNIVEAAETCDGNCPSSCNDNNPCTVDTLLGSLPACTAACQYSAVPGCGSSSSSSSGGQPPRVDRVTATGTGQPNVMVGHPRGWNNWAYPTYGALEIDATVSDPNGLGDISGGYVRLASGRQRVGTFTGSVGSYTARVNWADLTAHQAVNHPTGGSQPVALEVVFLDQASHEGISPLNISMECEDSAACGGVCVDLNLDDANCGTCGHSCSSRTSCEESACLMRIGDQPRQSCRAFCAARGMQCGQLTCQNAPATACAMYNFPYGAACSFRSLGFGCDEAPPASMTLDCYGMSESTTFLTMSCTCQE